MIFTVYAISLFLFCSVFVYSKIIFSYKQTISIFLHAIEILADHTIDEQDKATTIRTLTYQILKNVLLLTLKVGLLLAATAFPFWLADALNLATHQSTVEFASRSDVITLTAVVFVGIWIVRKKTSPASKKTIASSTIPYSHLDRVVHNIAFGPRILQRILVSLEATLFSNRYRDIPLQKPVFVTSLPRAGTTILLESIYRLPTYATHTYRDMPFLLTPVLWHKFNKNFQRRATERERIHGDGLRISEDSPEAFEEVLWHKLYPHKYQNKRIGLWKTADSNFTTFLCDHMKKVIFLRSSKKTNVQRYLSKNNANIARIPALREMFADAIILVPVRDPFEHAISMHRQHTNFCNQHEKEPFIKKYMADIGHFEFGQLHRPIQFEKFNKLSNGFKSLDVNYWLAYWIAAFDHLKRFDDIDFLRYESFANSGFSSMTTLCQHLDIEVTPEEIMYASEAIRAQPPTRKNDYTFRQDLSEQAEKLHIELSKRSLV